MAETNETGSRESGAGSQARQGSHGSSESPSAPLAPGERGSDEQPDTVSLIYIVAGIPAMVAFFILLFILTHLFGLPA